MKIISINELDFELLKKFDCGNKELNSYLKDYALQNSNKNISKTFILIENDEILGYYSLSNAQIGFNEVNDEIKKRLPKYPIPAIRIARFAISKNKHRQGYGKLLLKDAFIRILQISLHTGIYFVIVDSKIEAKSFYERFGFISLNDNSLTYLLKLDTIKKALLKSQIY